jgi:hypothetical protein
LPREVEEGAVIAAPLAERLRRLLPRVPRDVDGRSARRIDVLERRLTHLEAELEGLQDALHRESVRHKDELAGLRHRTEPREMARTLSDDARKRGI